MDPGKRLGTGLKREENTTELDQILSHLEKLLIKLDNSYD